MELTPPTSTLHYSTSSSSLVNCIINHRSNSNLPLTRRCPPPFSSSSYNRRLNVGPTSRFSKWAAFCTSLPSPPDDEFSPDRIGVIVEVDGVLIDAYRTGNRHAFNVAFRKLGLDCANWTQPIYSDLLRKGAGDEEKMLALYFNRIGWPTSLPTSEKDAFVKSVLQEKKKALAEYMSSEDTPLRPGVEQFIDDACDEGVCVVVLTAISKFGEDTARAIVEKLGHGRISKLKVVGKKEIEKSLYGQLMLGLGKFSGPEEELANEASKAVAAERKRIAEEVSSMLKLRVDINIGTPESIREIVTALRAGAEKAEASVHNCVFVTGSQTAIAAARITGMPCVVLRSSLTSRAEFPSEISVMDGFGDVDLTISKLRLTLSKSSR